MRCVLFIIRGVSPCRKLGLVKCNATKASQGDDLDGWKCLLQFTWITHKGPFTWLEGRKDPFPAPSAGKLLFVCWRSLTNLRGLVTVDACVTCNTYRDPIWRLIVRIRWKVSAWPSHLSRGNRRLITPYILLSNLLLIISYLGGLVMRGASALIMANHFNRFSNGSPSPIRVIRD